MIQALIERLDRWANPVMVKELRQQVKGRVTISAMMIMLVMLIWIFAVISLNQNTDSQSLGAGAFSSVMGVLGLITLIIIPFTVFSRTGTEREPDNRDLMYITAMTPRTIILGKYGAGILLTGLYLFAALPFIVFTYLLKGIDLLTIAQAIFWGLVAVWNSLQCAVLLGALGIAKRSRSGILIILVFFGMFAVPGMMNGLFFGRGLMMGGFSLSGLMVETILIITAVSVWLYLLTEAVLLPESANRMMMPRIWTSLCWLVSLGWLLVFGRHDLLVYWMGIFLWVALIGLLGAISEPDQFSARIRKKIPGNWALRVLVFPWFSGSGGGIVWSVGTMVVTYLVWLPGSRVTYYRDEITAMLMTLLSIIGYCMAVFLMTRGLKNDTLRKKAWILTIVLAAIITAMAAVLSVLGGGPNAKNVFIVTPLCGVILNASWEWLILLLSWAGVTTLLSLVLVSHQWRAFKPLDPPADIPRSTAVAEPLAGPELVQ